MSLTSVQFNFPGSSAINLVDPATNVSLGATPEWAWAQGRNVPAAYVMGTTIVLNAEFDGDHPWSQVVYNGGTVGLSNSGPEQVTLEGLLDIQNAVGIYTVTLTWQTWVPDGKSGGDWENFAVSTHQIYMTASVMNPSPADGLTLAIYEPLVRWSCTWAAGLTDPKAICDAVIANLAQSGLKYGVRAWDIRSMLLQGGGMCGGWAKMFQYIVYGQGVYVYRRAFLVNWRALSNQEVQWAAIVCTAAGLNQGGPPVAALQYQDDNMGFPITSAVALSSINAARWVFWGSPAGPSDGHVVDFLVYRGSVYLYDPSFGTGPFPLQMSLPPSDGTILGGSDLSSFRTGYLNTAVPYMMGALHDAQGKLWPASPGPVSPGTGITVSASVIPDYVGSFPEITFYWTAG